MEELKESGTGEARTVDMARERRNEMTAAVWGVHKRDWEPRVERSQHTSQFACSLPFRGIVVYGETEREAIGGLIRSYAEMAFDGNVDPRNPYEVGAPPIQHVLNILSSMLAERVAEREANRQLVYDASMSNPGSPGTVVAEEDQTWGSAYRDSGTFKRDNEVIGGLATAIAALSRVKEL